MTPQVHDLHGRIGSSRLRRTPAALGAVWLLLSWASIAGGAHGQPPHCSLRHDGVQVIAEFSSQDARKGHQMTFDLVVSGSPPERRASSLTIARGGRLVLQLESKLADASALRVRLTAGTGFHGFHEERRAAASSCRMRWRRRWSVRAFSSGGPPNRGRPLRTSGS